MSITTDPTAAFADSIAGPALRADAVTLSDTQPLSRPAKALYIGTGGDVTLRALGSAADVTFLNVPSGAVLDVRTQVVRATGTTARNLVALA